MCHKNIFINLYENLFQFIIKILKIISSNMRYAFTDMKGNTTIPHIFSVPVDTIISLEIIEFLFIFIQPSFTKSNKRELYV